MFRCGQTLFTKALLFLALSLAGLWLIGCASDEKDQTAFPTLVTAPSPSPMLQVSPTSNSIDPTSAGSKISLVVLHTNDVDGNVEPCG